MSPLASFVIRMGSSSERIISPVCLLAFRLNILVPGPWTALSILLSKWVASAFSRILKFNYDIPRFEWPGSCVLMFLQLFKSLYTGGTGAILIQIIQNQWPVFRSHTVVDYEHGVCLNLHFGFGGYKDRAYC